MLQGLNPAMYLKWMLAPLDPRMLQAMVAPMNPNVYLGWLGTMMNPASYGDLWKGFLTPAATPIPSCAVPAAPAGTQPSIFNPFDPAAWARIWTVPGTTAPASPAAPLATAPAAPSATAPATPAQPYIFNPFDPASWTQLWQVPGQQPAAPAQK